MHPLLGVFLRSFFVGFFAEVLNGLREIQQKVSSSRA